MELRIFTQCKSVCWHRKWVEGGGSSALKAHDPVTGAAEIAPKGWYRSIWIVWGCVLETSLHVPNPSVIFLYLALIVTMCLQIVPQNWDWGWKEIRITSKPSPDRLKRWKINLKEFISESACAEFEDEHNTRMSPARGGRNWQLNQTQAPGRQLNSLQRKMFLLRIANYPQLLVSLFSVCLLMLCSQYKRDGTSPRSQSAFRAGSWKYGQMHRNKIFFGIFPKCTG